MVTGPAVASARPGTVAIRRVIAEGLAVGLLSSVIPYRLELEALRRVPAGVFGIWMSLEPAVAALVGLVLLSEALIARQWLAIALVIIACAARPGRPPARGVAGELPPPPAGDAARPATGPARYPPAAAPDCLFLHAVVGPCRVAGLPPTMGSVPAPLTAPDVPASAAARTRSARGAAWTGLRCWRPSAAALRRWALAGRDHLGADHPDRRGGAAEPVGPRLPGLARLHGAQLSARPAPPATR